MGKSSIPPAENRLTVARVLMIGSDPVLLQTRGMVLERFGFEVIPATRPSEVDKILQSEHLDLLILCHSLASHQCEEVVELAHRHDPTLKVLALTTGSAGCAEAPKDEMLNVFEGPRTLLTTIHRIIGDTPAQPISRQVCFP